MSARASRHFEVLVEILPVHLEPAVDENPVRGPEPPDQGAVPCGGRAAPADDCARSTPRRAPHTRSPERGVGGAAWMVGARGRRNHRAGPATGTRAPPRRGQAGSRAGCRACRQPPAKVRQRSTPLRRERDVPAPDREAEGREAHERVEREGAASVEASAVKDRTTASRTRRAQARCARQRREGERSSSITWPKMPRVSTARSSRAGGRRQRSSTPLGFRSAAAAPARVRSQPPYAVRPPPAVPEPPTAWRSPRSASATARPTAWKPWMFARGAGAGRSRHQRSFLR